MYTVVGTSMTTDGVGVSGIHIGFELSTCATNCTPIVAVTGNGGAYTVSLAPGTYVAACVAGRYKCETVEAARGTARAYNVDSNATINFEVEVGSSALTGSGTSAPASSTITQSRADADSFSSNAVAQDGSPVPGVTVSFRRIGCDTCQPITAITGTDGFYTVHLPPGTYTTSCTYPGAACTPQPGSDGTLIFDTASELPSPFDVAIPAGPNGPQPVQPQIPELSGHVRTPAGEPVADADITLKPAGGSNGSVPHTTTDASGAYAFYVVGGVYNAICDSNSVVDGACGAKGTNGGPNPVSMNGSAGTLDFIACPQSQFPACLKQ